MTVWITVHAREGAFYRDETGLERLDVDSYGDPQSNAELMAFTPLRSVSRLRLVSPRGGPVWVGAASLRRGRLASQAVRGQVALSLASACRSFITRRKSSKVDGTAADKHEAYRITPFHFRNDLMRYLTTLLLFCLFVFVSACDSGPGPNEMPSVSFSYSPTEVRAGEVVSFTANASDADGQIQQYSWDFDGDGTQDASGPNPQYVFEQEGSFRVSLTVTDDRDGQSSARRTISIAQRYTQVEVTSATVRDMPFTNDQGQGWDLASGPEVYFAAFDGLGEQTGTSNYYRDVAPGNLPLSFQNVEFLIDDFGEEYEAFLVDYDATTTDDVIGSIIFTVDGLGIVGDYPSTATLDAGGITLDLDLTWRK